MFTLQKVRHDAEHASETRLTSSWQILDSYTAILAPMAPLLAEEIHHFGQGALSDPQPGTSSASSIFHQVWPGLVSS